MPRRLQVMMVVVIAALLSGSSWAQTLPDQPGSSDGQSSQPGNPTDPTIAPEDRFDLTSAGSLQARAPGNWIRRAQQGPQINDIQEDTSRRDMFTEFAVSMVNTISSGVTTMTQTLVTGLASGFIGVIQTVVPDAVADFANFLEDEFGIVLPGGDTSPTEPPPTTVPPGDEIPVE